MSHVKKWKKKYRLEQNSYAKSKWPERVCLFIRLQNTRFNKTIEHVERAEDKTGISRDQIMKVLECMSEKINRAKHTITSKQINQIKY